MMLVVSTVTRNKYKVRDLQKAFSAYNISVEHISDDCPEIQADTCEEVAGFAARFMADKYSKPIVKEDFGFFIEVLGGLPGVYASQFHKKLGVKKLLKLMEGESNRNAYMMHALAYCEPGKEPVVFTHKINGRISKIAKSSEKWLTDIFIPDGESKTLGEIRESSREKELSFYGHVEKKFAKWFANKK